MYFHTLTQTIGTLSVAAVFAYALRRGGRPERLVAMLIFLDWMATPILQHFSDRSHFEATVFFMDAVLTTALLGVAITSDRYWPLWVTGFQLLELLMHVAVLIDKTLRGHVYFIGMEIWSYFILIALAAGVWLEAPRRPRTGLAPIGGVNPHAG